MANAIAVTVLAGTAGFGATGHAAEAGFYFGAEGAYVAPTVGKSDGTNFFRPPEVIHVPTESVRSDHSEFGWGAMIGYRVGPHLAVELGYLDFGSIDVEETFDLTDVFPFPVGPPDEFSVDFNLKVAGPMASVIGTLPVSERIETFGRAGVLWATQEVQLTPHFGFNEAEELWGLGVGIRAELSRRWSARLEYQRFEDMPGTAVSGDSRLERLTLGATYNLGTRADAADGRGALAEGAEPGFYAVADVGVTESTVGKSGGFLLSFAHVPGAIFQVLPTTATADGADTGAGAAVGYRINRYFATEFAYTDFGRVEIREHYVFGPIDDPFPIPQLVTDVELASRVAGPSLSLLGILPVADNFEVFGRAGILLADREVSGSPESSSTVADELLLWGAGVDIAVYRGWSVRFGYENLEEMRRTVQSGPIRHERFAVGVTYDF